MIRFVIVENEEKYIREIRNIIDKFKYKTDREIKTYVFKGYDNNLKRLISNCDERTIYILDINVDYGKSGIEIASIIRKNDWDSEIIFITNHDKMFETVHRNVYEVFDFIEKYHEFDKRLTRDLDVIMSRITDKKIFSYKGRSIDIHLYIRSINFIYRDKQDRKVVIVTTASSFSINLGIKEILTKLDKRFKMVHRSCIVNTDKVSSYDWRNSKINMSDGTEVQYLSKRYKKEFIEK